MALRTILALSVVLAACGDDGGGNIADALCVCDAPNPPDAAASADAMACAADLAPTDDGGEVILYKSANFSTSADIIDFVCWGVNPHGSRVTQARDVGKWDMSAPCADALPVGGSIERNMGSDGTDASSYTALATPSGENCE